MKNIIPVVLIIILLGLPREEIKAQDTPGKVDGDELVMYPNPTDGPLHVEFITQSRVKPNAFILDITGKQVKQIASDLVYSDGRFSADISLSDLNPGIYFVKVNQLQKTSMKKIMIK